MEGDYPAGMMESAYVEFRSGLALLPSERSLSGIQNLPPGASRRGEEGKIKSG